MDDLFEIRFAKSTSTNYTRVLRIAKRFSNFNPISDRNNYNSIQTDTTELLNKYKTLEELLVYITYWKSTEIFYNSEQIEKQNFFYPFKKIIDCYNNQAISVDKDTYCFLNHKKEAWGCRYLTGIKRHLEQGNTYRYDKYWYEFGKFENDFKDWKINKPLLKETLLEEVKENKIATCPVFSFDKLNQIINELPEKITLSKNNSWKIEYEKDFSGGKIEKKPIIIRHKGYNFSTNSIISSSSPAYFNEENKQVEARNIPNVTFADIGGIDNIIEQIREVIELPLKKPELLKHLRIKPHKGILLYGPPGNGKTMIAKAIANEVKAHFITISASELISKYYGESEENLRNIFKEAKEFQPSIIFFDEIDSIAQKRSGGETARHDSKFVNQLLTLMDGMETYENVSVLASTNRPELLDVALLRPGRFDYKIEVKNPDLKGCFKIFSILTTNMPFYNIDHKKFSQKLFGLSGAEIAFVVKEAAYNSMRRNLDLTSIIKSSNDYPINEKNILITIEDLEAALKKVKQKAFEKE